MLSHSLLHLMKGTGIQQRGQWDSAFSETGSMKDWEGQGVDRLLLFPPEEACCLGKERVRWSVCQDLV